MLRVVGKILHLSAGPSVPTPPLRMGMRKGDLGVERARAVDFGREDAGDDLLGVLL